MCIAVLLTFQAGAGLNRDMNQLDAEEARWMSGVAEGVGSVVLTDVALHSSVTITDDATMTMSDLDTKLDKLDKAAC